MARGKAISFLPDAKQQTNPSKLRGTRARSAQRGHAPRRGCAAAAAEPSGLPRCSQGTPGRSPCRPRGHRAPPGPCPARSLSPAGPSPVRSLAHLPPLPPRRPPLRWPPHGSPEGKHLPGWAGVTPGSRGGGTGRDGPGEGSGRQRRELGRE